MGWFAHKNINNNNIVSPKIINKIFNLTDEEKNKLEILYNNFQENIIIPLMNDIIRLSTVEKLGQSVIMFATRLYKLDINFPEFKKKDWNIKELFERLKYQNIIEQIGERKNKSFIIKQDKKYEYPKFKFIGVNCSNGIKNILQELEKYPIKIKTEEKLCKSNKNGIYRMDISIYDRNNDFLFYIEYDGKQHHIMIPHFNRGNNKTEQIIIVWKIIKKYIE